MTRRLLTQANTLLQTWVPIWLVLIVVTCTTATAVLWYLIWQKVGTFTSAQILVIGVIVYACSQRGRKKK